MRPTKSNRDPLIAELQSTLHTLSDMTTPKLRELWDQVGVRGKPPHFKQALVRGLAWHLQAASHGRLEAHTRRRLKAAIKHAPVVSELQGSPRPARKQREPLQLPEGTTLVRSWRGRKHEVRVIENGQCYQYRDSEYRSLSEIAREITGARWSGPRFFGLKKLKQPV